jgi:RHS repeat-associated protein
MKIKYEPNGNISDKTGLGKYKYHATKLHAVSGVDNTGGLISAEEQNIAYTAFNKASNIKEKVNSDSYELNIVYGPDQQRWKSELKKNSAVTKTTIYAGDYEKITENGITKQLYYISGGDGLAAICVKQPRQSGTIYYVHRDHLGSILSLTDANGTAVFKASYDAWGKQTVTTNTFKFHRGFTGHEHLPEFALINMNGRMYDPILGRFLSPDPFVQAPDFSQSFNRYSYCVNNPLIYTDPSGEVFGIDDALIIAAMAYIGGMQANFSYAAANNTNPFNPGNWNWKSANTYIGIAGGAMSGAGIAGYPIPYTQVPGMLPNGALQAGIQVSLNGIGNLTDGRKFFDNWYWSAGMGFASGAFSGYGLAKEKGLNYWWGNKVKYNRTAWSFYNVDKPDYVIDFGISNVGSKAENDCVPTTFTEIETRMGGSRTYENFKNYTGYKEGEGVLITGTDYDNLIHNKFGNVETLKSRNYNNLFIPEYMQNAAAKGEIFSVHFGPQNAHADNVRALQVFLRDSSKNRLIFRQSHYNFQRWNNNNILNIFRIF